jgi:two-component system sensor histidine kinase AlgZ
LTAVSDPTSTDTQVYLPDFCAAGTLFIVLVVAELVAIALTLASYAPASQFLLALSKISFFVLWLALLGSALMCVLRDRLERAGKTRAFVISFVLLELLCLAVAELAWLLPVRVVGVHIIVDTHSDFLLRTMAISSIILALGMRYLYVSSEWRRSIMLEAQARISALQALIRPHFLFNTMNTIASLTRTNPRLAEEAVEDLSDLLRASLSSNRDRLTLKQEIEVAAIYHRIEKLRLGNRLNVRWEVDDLPTHVKIPHLTLQPLIENAIYHGIELLPDGGDVVISGKRDGRHLVISVTNTVAPGKARAVDGNKMALANIRQRFELAYGSRASVKIEADNNRYTVTLRFPDEEHGHENPDR